MIVNWDEINDVFELGKLLIERGLFSSEIWRDFHCKCGRNVWGFLTEQAREAIAYAERVVSGEISPAQLASMHHEMTNLANEAWDKVESLIEPSDNKADAIWPLSDEVDSAWCIYLSAEFAKVVTQAEIDAYTIPDSASSLAAWATARKSVLRRHQQESRELVEARWKQIRAEEEKRQASILRTIVSSKAP